MEQIYEELGWIAKWEARGKAEGKAEVAWNLLKAGISRDIIFNATGLTIADLEKIPDFA